MADGKRDYKKEYREYHGKPAQVKNRSSRNKARGKLAKDGRVSEGDGKDVDHKDGNPKNNKPSNLRVVSRKTNRSKKAYVEAGRLLSVAKALIAKAQADAPNYRPASDQARCANCRHFDGQQCDRYSFAADADYICDGYEASEPMQEMRALLEKAGARHSRMDNRLLQTIHDMAVQLGACCPTHGGEDE